MEKRENKRYEAEREDGGNVSALNGLESTPSTISLR